MNIGVDVMGGDYAPDAIVQGALSAYAELGVNVTLVGDQKGLGLSVMATLLPRP